MKVICFMGLPGTGKTTLSKEVHKLLPSSVYLSSDEIRKKLFVNLDRTSFKEQIYSTEYRQIIYNAIYLLLEKIDPVHEYVIVDATFSSAKHRNQIKDKVRTMNGEIAFIITQLSEDLVKFRIENRDKTRSQSDADYSVFMKLKDTFHVDDLIDQKYITVDTSKQLIECANQVIEFVRQ